MSRSAWEGIPSHTDIVFTFESRLVTLTDTAQRGAPLGVAM